MARSTKKRQQLNVRLPGSLAIYLEDIYHGKGWEKPLQVIAGLVALECLSEPMRLTMIQWATRVVQDEDAWKALLETVKRRKGAVLDQRSLVESLNSLAAIASPKSERRRRV